MNSTTAAFCTCLSVLLLAAVTSAMPYDISRCLRACPRTFNPVCDNQGTTHPNLCTMQVVACRRRVTLQAVHNGICQSSEPKPSAAPSVPRRLLGRIISLFSDRPKETAERCSYVCPLQYQPVCASDRRTYPNECAMRSQACMRQEHLTVRHGGACHFWER